MVFGEAAARSPLTRPEKLARLARSSNPAIRALVALNPSSPPSVYDKLATDWDQAVLEAVASSTSAPAGVLEDLCKHQAVAVREAAAKNPSTPPAALAKMVKTRATDQVRLAVAANPSTPAATLAEMRISRNFSSGEVKQAIYIALASNPSTPPESLQNLFRREDSEGRYRDRKVSATEREINKALACNPSTPFSTRVELYKIPSYSDLVVASAPMKAPEWLVSRARAASGSEAAFLSRNPDPKARQALTLARGAGADILSALAADPSPSVSSAARARITTDLLEIDACIATGNLFVLETLLRNAVVTAEQWSRAALGCLSSAGNDTFLLIAKDSRATASVLDSLLGTISTLPDRATFAIKQAISCHPSVSEGALAKLAADADSAIRTLVSKSKSVPLANLVSLTTDSDPKVREAAAQNPSTPTELLMRLALDDSSAVVEAVSIHQNATAAVLDRLVKEQFERRKHLSEKSRYARKLPEFPLGPLSGAAAHPNTDPDTLRTLAESVSGSLEKLLGSYSRDEAEARKELAIWSAISGNPSAPSDLLDWIAREVHTKVQTTAKPKRGYIGLDSLRETMLKKIIKNPSAPLDVLKFLSDGEWIARRTKVEHERSDAGPWSIKTTVWDYEATRAAKQDMASSILEEIALREWTTAEGFASQLAFAANPNAPRTLLVELSSDTHVAVRSAVAGNPSTPPNAFEQLADDLDTLVRMAAAGATHPDSAIWKQANPYAKPQRVTQYRSSLDRLARDSDAGVRAALAANVEAFWYGLSSQGRDALVLDQDSGVRSALLQTLSSRPKNLRYHGDKEAEDTREHNEFGVSAVALVHLIDTSDPEAWQALLGNYHGALPQDVLLRLADTGDTETVKKVVSIAYIHRDLPVLIRLAESGDVGVVEHVAELLRYRDDERKLSDALQVSLIKNPLTPPSYLLRVARSCHADARHRNLGQGSSLESSEYENFLERVEQAVEARDAESSHFLEPVLAHPNFPEDALEDFASGEDVLFIEAAIRTGNAGALVAAAANSATPPSTLARLATASSPEVREALLVNPSTPADALVGLISSSEN